MSMDLECMGKKCLLNAAECETLFNETKYGIEHLTIKEPFLAVYIGQDICKFRGI